MSTIIHFPRKYQFISLITLLGNRLNIGFSNILEYIYIANLYKLNFNHTVLLVRDIDKKLDMRLILRLRQRTEFFDFTKDLGMTLPVYIYGKEGQTWMTTFLPKASRNQKIDLLKLKFSGIELENSIAIETRINNVKDLDVINKISGIPSFVINRSDMSDGFLNVYGRFHSAQIEEVSNLLAEYTADSDNSRVSWLGPSMGIVAITEMTNEMYPLSLVCYRVAIDKEESYYTDLFMEPGILAEVRNNMYKDGKISVVLYSDSLLEDKYPFVEAISPKDGVYQMEVENKFHNLVREIANERHIMRTRYFIKHIGNKLEMQVFVPTSSVYEYSSILYDMARQHKNNVIITALKPYSEDVWNFV